jgi:hypothetical protein
VFSDPSIAATADTCGNVALTVNGRAEPPLSVQPFDGSGLAASWSFTARLMAMLGLSTRHHVGVTATAEPR